MKAAYTNIFWWYVTIMSCTTIYAKARPTPVTIPKWIMSAYNIGNSMANLWIVFLLAPYVCNVSLGATTPFDETVAHCIYLHYLCKYLDFFDTFTMILRHKWNQVHFLQLFHHATIGVIWYWVLADCPRISATIAFGVFANSLIHFFMYLHYFVTSIGLRNPFKSYLTAMQMTQFVVCLGHAAHATVAYGNDMFRFAAVQCAYMSTMLLLFYVYVYRSRATKTTGTEVGAKTSGKPGRVPKQLHVRINGAVRDVSAFLKRHPGGNIIEKYDVTAVPDASDAFSNFHFGSKRAEAMLKALPIVTRDDDLAGKTQTSDEDSGHVSPVGDDLDAAPVVAKATRTATPLVLSVEDSKISNDFRVMLQQWETRGLYGGGQLEFLAWAVVVAGLVYAGFYTLGAGHPVVGGLIVGFAWGQCGFVQHHAGHLAFTGVAGIDYVVQSLMESLLKGGSGRWWRNRHNKHHAMPNSFEHDGDLRTTPFFAWDDVLIRKVPTVFLRLQHIMFLPLLAIYVPVLATSVYGMVFRRKYWDEIGLICTHFFLASKFYNNVSDFLLFYFIGYAVQGVYLGCMFGMSHYTMPRKTDESQCWAKWQLETTCNWGVGSRFADYISGFLNLQIEHHVATKMPAENYHLVCDDIRSFAKKHDIPYREFSFWEAFSMMILGLRDTGVTELARRRAARVAKKAA
eukprot:m.26448 g.26448  ORF g.26448 m.26448 type:complete len:682 (-) comp13327_c0_seq3:130-2175(-)